MIVSSVICAAADNVDCTGFRPWSTKISGNPDPSVGFKAHYKGNGYVATTWVDASNVPGKEEYGPWNLQGTCLPGTASDVDSGGITNEIDCSLYVPWTKQAPIVGNPKSYLEPLKVYVPDTGIAYESTVYADATNIPGDAGKSNWSPWNPVGRCAAGTSGDGLAEMDCSEIYAWSPYLTFLGSEIVHDKAYSNDNITRVWSIKWWTEGDVPALGDSSPYDLLGKCKAGTDNLGPQEDVNPPAQWKLDLTCLCCEKCGAVKDGQLVCIDTVEEKCWYKWCEGSGELDEGKCKVAKDSQKFAYWDGELTPSPAAWPAQVYAPYFDGGLAQYPPLTDIMDKYDVKHFILAFIVSATLPEIMTGQCQGAFAGSIPLEVGPTSYFNGSTHYLYDELNRVRAKGGDFVASFGGANGTELADSEECQSGDPVANLVAEYGRALDMLKTNRIDFDIEGAAYANIQAEKGWTYRFNAVKELKKQRPDLHVTWTLPILPTGLTPADGVAFFDKMFELDAPFNLINVMNMDYGDCDLVCKSSEIDQCERDAIDNLVKQLFDLATKYNKTAELKWSSPEDVYSVVGSTPMLGLNDSTCLTYTLEAAKTNLKHWQEKKIALISNWSLHRDMPCAFEYVDVGCSSYPGQTAPYQFAEIFSSYGKQ